MKILVDREKCTGLGICEAFASQVFEIDDDGNLLVLVEDVPADAFDAVESAVAGCPTEALKLAQG